MTSPEDHKLAAVTRQLRQQSLREEELAKQRVLLQGVEMTDFADTVSVIKADTPALVLVDAEFASIEVPVFQFLKTTKIKRDEASDIPLINPGVLAIFRQQCSGFDRPSKLNPADAWFMLAWWTTEMRLDDSDPESKPFRPIDVVHDSAILDKLVDWFKHRPAELHGSSGQGERPRAN